MTKFQNTALDWLKDNWYKAVALFVLIGALGHHPYAYYQMTRWIVCAAALYSAYSFYRLDQKFPAMILTCIAVLFNPISPFYLAQHTWQVFDAIGALIFAAAIFWPEKFAQQESK